MDCENKTFLTGKHTIKCNKCGLTVQDDQELVHKTGCQGLLWDRPNNLPPNLETIVVDGVSVTKKLQ